MPWYAKSKGYVYFPVKVSDCCSIAQKCGRPLHFYVRFMGKATDARLRAVMLVRGNNKCSCWKKGAHVSADGTGGDCWLSKVLEPKEYLFCNHKGERSLGKLFGVLHVCSLDLDRIPLMFLV